MALEDYRKGIDALDKELLTLLKKRYAISMDVARFKFQEGKAVLDKGRESEIIAEKKRLAEEYGLSPEFIEKLFVLIMEESRRVQEKLIEELKTE